jgi:hypothetical protein
VTDVIEGRSFIWEFDGDTEIRHEVRFNADQAKASTVHLVVEPSRSIDPSGDVASSDPVIVGVSFDAPVDIAAIRKEFTSTGEIVLLLYDSSEVFNYEDNLWAVLEDGTFIGFVADDETVAFPFVDEVVSSDDIALSGLETPVPGPPIVIETVDWVVRIWG